MLANAADTDTIAVVVPLYNKERFVSRAIESVLGQTRPVDEIIVIDDASTDDSDAQVRSFRNKSIKLLRRTEPGPGGYAARNLGIRSATSRWIAFLDADDTWKPNFVEELFSMIESAPREVGCVFTGYEKVRASGKIERDIHSAHYRNAGVHSYSFEGFLADWIALGSAPVWTSACAIRRDVLLRAGLFPEGRCRRGGDKDMWLRAMAHSNGMFSPKVCATYHTVTQNQVSRQISFNITPCLIHSVMQMLPEATGRRRTLLRRLVNLELYEYALLLGPRERMASKTYEGFFVLTNPFRYLVLRALTLLPASPRNALRRLIVKSRSVSRKIASRGRLALATE